ncbi:hypothetical protein NL676_036693 [Syzygium grande]|nr:hypothetical protein NL676_036693 [Syzygium grande]
MRTLSQRKEKKKIEVGGNVEGVFDLGPGRFGSEAIFVPREPDITPEEDDGCLIFFVHDENTGKSAVTVIDAKNMSSDPVAVVELPHGVPYGFHAFFVSEVVREIQHLRTGVIVTTEDGCVYNANYAILSVSIGALQIAVPGSKTQIFEVAFPLNKANATVA